MSVRAKIDGDNARIEFEESASPWMTSGSYLLTTDAGQTLFLVNPEEKTYGAFDLDEVMKMLGSLSDSGVIDFQIENPQLETLERGPGKTVAGLATEHARYRTSYDMRMKILGFKTTQNVQTVQDVWYTTAVGDAGMGVWLRKEPPRTGTDLDELIDLEVAKIEGFPLETVQTTINTGKKGKQTTTTTHMLVSDLQQGASFPAGTFVIPADYTEMQLMPTEAMMAAGQESPSDDEGEEQKGGLLGRFKKFGKKKDG
jgi:hypothetical protein